MIEDHSGAKEHPHVFAHVREMILRHGWLLLILLLGLVLRMYRIDSPPSDNHCWRQAQTLMVARNFLHESMNLFAPAVDWRRTTEVAERGIVGGTELQIVPWLTAILYRVFGLHHWVGRVVPIAFSLLGLAYFYALIRRFHGLQCAVLGAFLLTVSPMHLFFGRVQMPEAFAFAMSFATLYHYGQWAASGWKKGLVPALLACILMLLAKPQMVFTALPMAWITVRQCGWAFWRERRLYLFALLTALPLSLYVWYSYGVLTARTGISFAQPGLLNHALIANPEYHIGILSKTFFLAVGPTVSVLAILGLMRSKDGRHAGFAPAWLMAALLFYLLMPGGNSANDYYQMAFAPPACLLAARIIEWALKGHKMKYAAMCVIAAAALQSVYLAWGLVHYPEVNSARVCGEWLNENTPEDALILTSAASPTSLYFADRKGWTCWFQNYGEKIDFDRQLIQQTKDLGAYAVAIPDGLLLDSARHLGSIRYKDTRDFLYDTYAVHRGENFAVFLLNEPADLSPPESGKLLFGTLETRKYLRGSWGYNQHAASGEPFIALGPGEQGSIHLKGLPGQQRFLLKISSAVENQKVLLTVDDSTGEIALPNQWQQVEIAIDPGPPRDLHTLTLQATEQNDMHDRLLLFSLEIVQAPHSRSGT